MLCNCTPCLHSERLEAEISWDHCISKATHTGCSALTWLKRFTVVATCFFLLLRILHHYTVPCSLHSSSASKTVNSGCVLSLFGHPFYHASGCPFQLALHFFVCRRSGSLHSHKKTFHTMLVEQGGTPVCKCLSYSRMTMRTADEAVSAQ